VRTSAEKLAALCEHSSLLQRMTSRVRVERLPRFESPAASGEAEACSPESMMTMAKGPSSIMKAASFWIVEIWWSLLKHLHTIRFSSTSWGAGRSKEKKQSKGSKSASTLFGGAHKGKQYETSALTPKRSAMGPIFSGRKPPSVSMTATFPLPPPRFVGSMEVTHRVWTHCQSQEPEASAQHNYRMRGRQRGQHGNNELGAERKHRVLKSRERCQAPWRLWIASDKYKHKAEHAYLRLAGAEFAIDLSQACRFNAAAQQSIKTFAASRDLQTAKLKLVKG